ncbi:MAG: phosphatidylserine decarboxylase family protein, partial [Sediminibacterium sp.]|nr:phosphatidylserine decarboxylase family protein [Sediminibacterium sp.]
LLFFAFIISFFRIPNRELTIDENKIISPADGKIVVIEEVIADEFNLGKCIQISVFMSPANVHVNRIPINGKIMYNKYHPGKYLVAWHPKSSLLNERWSIVINNNKGNILCKQIAGAVAKRIVNYTKVGDNVNQTNEYGFIKFGSRVDVLIPLSATILVSLNQKVQGGVTCLATW